MEPVIYTPLNWQDGKVIMVINGFDRHVDDFRFIVNQMFISIELLKMIIFVSQKSRSGPDSNYAN